METAGFENRISKLEESARDLIFKVATGALVLSITFRSSLVGESSCYISFLKLSWIAFTCTIIFHLFMLYNEGIVWLQCAKYPNKEPSLALVFILHALVAGSFIAGIIFMLSYALLNS